MEKFDACTVWKYQLQMAQHQLVELPRVYRPLKLGMQGDRLCLWIMVDPTTQKVKRDVMIFGTGHQIASHVANDADFVGSVITPDGQFVWHVFMERA